MDVEKLNKASNLNTGVKISGYFQLIADAHPEIWILEESLLKDYSVWVIEIKEVNFRFFKNIPIFVYYEALSSTH